MVQPTVQSQLLRVVEEEKKHSGGGTRKVLVLVVHVSCLNNKWTCNFCSTSLSLKVMQDIQVLNYCSDCSCFSSVCQFVPNVCILTQANVVHHTQADFILFTAILKYII